MVSVIVPVYNAEKYLQAAIDSVRKQSYTDWELILVDDGSADSSPRICDRAAEESEKIRVIHTTNNGPSEARNIGLKIAGGDYITFLDADDLLEADALKIMMEAMNQNGTDIVCARFKGVEHDFRLSVPLFPARYKKCKDATVMTPVEAVEEILYQKGIDNSPWAKIYRASLWCEKRFRKGIRYEDLDLIPAVVLEAKSIASLHCPLYLYRMHDSSFIHTFSLSHADVLDVTARLQESLPQHYPALEKAAKARRLDANFNILGRIEASGLKGENPLKNANRGNDRNDDSFKAMLLADECWKTIKGLRGETLRNPRVRLKTKLGIIASYIGGRPLIELMSRYIYKS
ncbi:MAG: glycosyltransferase [Muribaculaceae bacterium]|nr:glycosyltransferase [Muribaculaceae bacterium]